MRTVKVEVPLFGLMDFAFEDEMSVAALAKRVSDKCGHTDATAYVYELTLNGKLMDPAAAVEDLIEEGTVLLFAKRQAQLRVGGTKRQSQALSPVGGRSRSNSTALSPRSRSNSAGSQAGPTAAAPDDTEDAPVVFLQIVMPNKMASVLRVRRDDPLAAVKTKAIDAYVQRCPTASRSPLRYVLRLQDKEREAIDLTKPVGSVSYVLGCRSSSMTPSFFLEATPGVSKLAKLAEKEVGALIGRPLCWTGGADEVDKFRHVMRLVRKQERMSKAKTASVDRELLGELEKTEFTVNILFPVLEGGVARAKTVQTSSQDTGDALRQRVFDKYLKV